MANNEDKKKALEAAIASKLEKDFGKGTVMRLGDPKAQVAVETVPTGSSEPGYRSGPRRRAEGKDCRDLWAGVQR